MNSTDRIALKFLIFTFLVFELSLALTFTNTSGTFARFPKWNACVNSSISFEFKTSSEKALLMYTDDNGKFDYVDVMIIDGRVRLRMNIVDGKDGTVEMTLGQRLNDRRWHRIEIQRNRMETSLYVDSFHDSRVAFGSDFHFGDVKTNNFVYFGGLPQSYYQGDQSRLKKLSLPSAFFVPRYDGQIRNVIYGNCTCRPERAEMISGKSVSRSPREACDVKNDCGKCLCISGDDGPGCQCVGFDCPTDVNGEGGHFDLDIHYKLPMDHIAGYTVQNPSGLDAKVIGSPRLIPGAVGNAIRLDCSIERIKVSGPGHREECFGDLSRCLKGYTLMMWLKFDEAGSGNGVYLSNGGERQNSHGVAMLYENGRLQWIFRMQTGREWRVTYNNFLEKKWYHVIVTWDEKAGLVLYINGNKAAQDNTPSTRVSTLTSPYNDFVIGQSNDDSDTRDLGIMTIDELQFWSTMIEEHVLREKGPIYNYHLTMDLLQGGQLIVPNLEPNTRGRLRQVSGKIGEAVKIPGQGQYIDLGSFTDSCLGNSSVCMYGFTVTFWINIARLEDNTYYMASGLYGFSIFSYSNRLYASVQNGDRQWQTSVSGIRTNTWYFVEVTWDEISGLELYLDQKLESSQRTSAHNEIRSTGYNNFFIGRANTVMYNEKYAAATIDDLNLYNADRTKLLNLDFIQRGKPTDHYYSFDAMSGRRITHPETVINTRGNVTLTAGKIGQAVRLNGNRQTVQFAHGDGCLGNLDYCRHGVLLALWFKLEKTEEGMFYLSSGINGIELSLIDKKLRVTAETSTEKWEVMTSSVEKNTWYYLEVTWSHEDGLKLYTNDMLLKEDRAPKDKRIANDQAKVLSDKFLLGRDNAGRSGSVYGAALYDEMEFWTGPRDYLMAFGYIQRGKPEHYIIHMDKIIDSGKRVAHALLPINLSGYPLLVPGKVNNAVKLDGNEQYIDMGENNDICLGNLDMCNFGISIFFWLKIDDYDYNMYILSTGRDGIRLYYNQEFIYITLNNNRKSWRISVPKVTRNDWHYLELSWHPEFGLDVYIDGKLQDHVTDRVIPEQYSGDRNHFYIGRPNSWDVQGQRFSYANMEVDELEIWYARRDELLAFDYIIRDYVGYESFSMETASNGVIDHPKYRVTLEQGARLAPGNVGNAVSLQGRGDYVNLGEHMDKCFANLDVCKQGLTISMQLKPESLKNNQYFLSSPSYSLYLQNGKLKADFYSAGKHWNVSSRNLAFNDWNNVLLSWDADEGLEMYLGDRMVDKSTVPMEMPQKDARAAGSVYIGKSSDTSERETAEMKADEVQYWYANLDKLKARGLYTAGPIHETISFRQMPPSGVLRLPGRRITLEGGATVDTGPQGRVISLTGKGQYINMGENLTCGGDLNNCRQGFTLRFAANPAKLSNNMYFMDSYPLSIFYKDGRLYATVRTETKTWTVAAPGFKVREWQNVDVSWHPEIGLTMYLNDEEVGAHKTHGTDIEAVYDYDRTTYFGRAMTNMINERYANTDVKSFDIWNVRRDVLMSKNMLDSSVPGGDGDTSDSDRNIDDGGRPTLPTPNIKTPPTLSSDDATKVLVTSAPQGGNSQDTNIGSRLIKNSISSTSKVIRFLGNSYIRYDFQDLPSEMLASADKESLSLEFITKVPDGLLWIFKGTGGRKMHISLQRGQLVFVIDNGRGTPQRVSVVHPESRALNDFNWHTFRIEKDGRKLQFYIDDKLANQVESNSDIQFVTAGADVYLGGSASTSTDTGGIANKNFDGALLDVETKKVMGPNREIIISFLQYIGDTTGDIEVIDPDKWNSGKFIWGTTRAPPTTAAPVQPTPVTFKSGSSMFYLRDALDMRPGGSIGFRFRTQEPRGLLVIARGSSQSTQFFAIEIFDGILYFVYDLGSVTSRKMFSDRRVDDGEWHEVKMGVQRNTLTLTLDNRPFSVTLPESDINRMYFYRIYFGGYEDYSRAPWPLYSRRGYRGCMEALQINEIGLDLHLFVRNQALQGVEIGCRTMARFCQTQPCVSGFCRDRMDGYICSCADTPYTGRNCDDNAPVAGWDGTYSTIFNFLNREVTHTNDLSFRFNTPLSNTILFRTEADNKEDFIQAELVEGRVKVTVKVDGQTKTFFTGNNLNDYIWHTLYFRRRADDIEVWVDDEPRMAGVIGGENFKLIIDRIKFGSFDNIGNYIGYMQNFIYDDKELFSLLKQQSTDQKWIVPWPIDNLPTPTYKPVTITTSDTFFQLKSMHIGLTMKLLFKFKTRESNGLILYNAGAGNDVIAVELSNGKIRLAYNLGGRNMFTVVPTVNMLNDNKWHTVQISLNERGQFTVRVDNEKVDVTTSDGDGLLNLSGSLYIGGMPAQMFQRPEVTSLIESTKGFRGCLASMDLNGAVPELLNYASDRTKILNGCTDLAMTCKPNACGPGVCMPSVDDYWCDCNMTGYTGIPCTDYPNGYYFGRQGNSGIIVYEFPYEKQVNSDMDTIAFGFMTEEENGVLYRLESSLDQKDFIEIRMEKGFIVAESNTGSGLTSVMERTKQFNDGSYHVVRYIRTGKNTTLQVDQLPMQTITHTGQASLFNKVYKVIIGGRVDSRGVQKMNFNGIIGGAYYNTYRWMDMLLAKRPLHSKLVHIRGDVELVKPFLLVKGGTKTTIAPPDIVIPPGGEIPGDIGGGGVIGDGIGGAGGGSPAVIGIGGPGGILGGPTGVGVDVVGGPVPLASGLVGPAPAATGARAGAVVGTVLGTLAFLSSLMWALYKLKPGVPTCISPGAGKAGGGGAGMSISSPRATSNLAVVQAASGTAAKPAALNGTAAAAGGGGGGSSTYTSYFQSTSTSVGGGAGGGAGGGSAMVADEIDSSTLRATGTFSNKGTAIGSPGANRRANMASASNYQSNTLQSNAANYQSNTLQSNASNYQSNTMQSYGSGGGGGGGSMERSYDRQYMSSTSGGDNIPDYDMPMAGNIQSGQSYSSSTLNTHYNYQMSESTNRTRTISVQQPSSQTHTSVLNIIMSNGKYYTMQPRSDVYSAAFAPSRDQGFVDRAEDMVIEQAPPTLRVRPIANANKPASTYHVSNVVLNTDVSSPFASYSNKTYARQQSLTNENVSKSSINIASSARKASLQVQPTSHTNSGYERLESCSSETNVNTLSNTRITKKKHQYNGSHDNMYESTVTVMSDVRSESIDNSLFSLDEEAINTAPNRLVLDLNVENNNFGGISMSTDSVSTGQGDYLYAKVNKQNKTPYDQNSSNNLTLDWNTTSTQNNIESTVSYSATCTAELKDVRDEQNDTATQEMEGNFTDHFQGTSFDDTIKAFENFADLGIVTNEETSQIEMQTSEQINKEFGQVVGSSNEQQTDRSENVIEYTPPTITNLTKRETKSSRHADWAEGGITDSSKGICETTFSITCDASDNTLVGNKFDLEAELNESVKHLLTGINVDTDRWTDMNMSCSAMDDGADSFQVQNLKTVTMNKQGQYVMSSATGGGAVTPGAAADEVRVDCCLMTSDGRSVVTGSSLGPPQVWDMQTGELQNIMKGDTIGSTNLHLVCGDRLLVGAVHADMEINEYSSRKGVYNHTLQIWDFMTGRPLSMAQGEYCSALCPMSDSDKVMFGRTDKFGDATSIIAWDLMGNQMIKEMRYDAAVGNNDYISYLNKSKNDRYIVAGFTNSFDNNAEFMTFDMTLTSFNINEPSMLKLDANPEVTAMLPKDEAVTGLRNGDLVVWNVRTAQPSRQLLGGGGAHAHSKEIKCVSLSDDSRYLVSGSADGTLKVWDMHTERPIHTLQGHTDEVWCTSISSDNEIVVSGSADGTIRLWRMKNGTEMCVFNCGVDIFNVSMSRDKGTIVALGDKYGARKLIMLQVVRTKIKKIVSS